MSSFGTRFTKESLAARTAKKTAPTGRIAPAPHALRTKPMFYLGIDPGVNTGFALWRPRHGAEPAMFVQVESFSFVAALRRLEFLVRQFGPAKLFVRLENPRGNRPTFERAGVNSGAVQNNISQKVGSNKRDAQLWADFLTELGVPYELLTPTKRVGVTGPDGKPAHADLAGFPGFPGKSNEHSRDASWLVVGL